MGLPEHVDDFTGAQYVVTHAGEFTYIEWKAAMLSCLYGEQGSKAQLLVVALADEAGCGERVREMMNKGET